MIKDNLTKEIIKSIIYVLALIIITIYLTLLVLNNIRNNNTTSFYNDNGLIVEIQEVIDKEVTTDLDGDNKKITVTNNTGKIVTYQILMSSLDNLEDVMVRVDFRSRNTNSLDKINDKYIVAEFDLDNNVTNQTLLNIYLNKGKKRNIKVKFEVVKKGDYHE